MRCIGILGLLGKGPVLLLYIRQPALLRPNTSSGLRLHAYGAYKPSGQKFANAIKQMQATRPESETYGVKSLLNNLQSQAVLSHVSKLFLGMLAQDAD